MKENSLQRKRRFGSLLLNILLEIEAFLYSPFLILMFIINIRDLSSILGFLMLLISILIPIIFLIGIFKLKKTIYKILMFILFLIPIMLGFIFLVAPFI